MTARCACGCGRAAVHRHHAVYAQAVRREGGSLKDDRNLVALAHPCHFDHHGRVRVLPVSRLPDSVFEFAVELLGRERAWSYLRRMYSGGDARLDALLEAA